MVNWKKSIKLSDLVPKGGKKIKLSDLVPKSGKKPDPEPVETVEEGTAPAKAAKPKRRLSLPGKGKSKEPRAKQKEPRSKRPPKPKRASKVKGRGGARHKRLVGLKIGASQLVAARMVNNGVPELVQIERDELEPGIVVGGEVRDTEALAEALKSFFTTHKLPRQGIRLGIASNRIGVRIFEITGVSDQKQLDNAIRFRAQETLPISLHEAVLDYQILGEGVDDEGKPTRRVLLVVAYRDLVDRYVAVCRKAGLKLAGIDLEAFALLRVLGERQEAHANAAIVVVTLGHERSTLAVSNGSVCEFTRVIEWGGANLNVAIARALDISPSEAEPIKHSVSLLEPAEPIEGLNPGRTAAMRTAIDQELQNLTRELVSSLQFYQGQPGSLGIGELVLTGGTAQLPGLDAELARLIGVAVRVGDPLARVKVGKKVAADGQLGSSAVAIGLGIEV